MPIEEAATKRAPVTGATCGMGLAVAKEPGRAGSGQRSRDLPRAGGCRRHRLPGHGARVSRRLRAGLQLPDRRSERVCADERDFDWLTAGAGGRPDVRLERGYRHDAALMVMGPRSREVLSTLADADLSAEAQPWLSVTEMRLGEADLPYMGHLETGRSPAAGQSDRTSLQPQGWIGRYCPTSGTARWRSMPRSPEMRPAACARSAGRARPRIASLRLP